MLGGISLGRLAGIPFYVHPSWFVTFGWVTYSLSTGYLRAAVPGMDPLVYWVLGGIIGLLFFASLLLHELVHCLVSRSYGIPVVSITLHLFGGASRLGREVGRPYQEFWIALAGPAASTSLAVSAWVVHRQIEPQSPALSAAVGLLAALNSGIVVFNMMPGFPLDGGRVLRSLLWAFTGSFRRSTEWATRVGRCLGFGLIGVAVFLTVRDGHPGDLWLALVGWFLVALAGQAYLHALGHERLCAYSTRDASVRLTSVPATLMVKELWVERAGRHFFVELRGEIVGLVGPRAFTRLPSAAWATTPLIAVMRPIDCLVPVDASAPAIRALALMDERGVHLLRAVEEGRAVGVVTREGILALARTGFPEGCSPARLPAEGAVRTLRCT